MTKIKDISIIILIIFIIVSILYGIHMFRYEFIIMEGKDTVIRYDRITNTQCISASRPDYPAKILDRIETVNPGMKFKKLKSCGFIESDKDKELDKEIENMTF
jgi:hypothetical protein